MITRLMNPDGRREHFVAEAARELGAVQSGLTKRGLSGLEVQHAEAASGADLQDARVVILDDRIRSGSTAIGAAKRANESGAREIWLSAIHPDFTPDALHPLETCGLFRGVTVASTWPQHVSLPTSDDAFLQVVPALDLGFWEALDAIEAAL